MTIDKYLNSRGLYIAVVAQQMGTSRQSLSQVARKGHVPTARTLNKIATAMTELGAPTTVVDLVAALYE